MKKIIYIFVVLCFLVSGCAINQENSIQMDRWKVGVYDQNKVILQRELSKSNMEIEIECENYKDHPTFTYHLYKNGVEVEEKEGVLFTDIRMNLIRNDDVLQIYEHVYYYDKEDASNNFVYNQVSDVLLYPSKVESGIINRIEVRDSKNFRWEVAEVIKAFTYSLETGLYNPKIMYALYTYITTLISSIFAIYILYHMFKYSMIDKRVKKQEMFDWVLIILFLLVLFVDYSDYDYLRSSAFDGRMIDAILKTLLLVGLSIRLFITMKLKKTLVKTKEL